MRVRLMKFFFGQIVFYNFYHFPEFYRQGSFSMPRDVEMEY